MYNPNLKYSRAILLVEDEAIIAMTESMLLEKSGYTVSTAYSGEDAVNRVKTGSFDLILMDIDLGEGIDGTEAAKIILSFCDVPIVFLSSHTEPEVVEKTEGITSYGYILKNSGSTVLLASVKMAFRLYKAKKALNEHECALETSRNAFYQLFSGLNNGAVIYRATENLDNFEIVDMNKAGLEIAGVRREEVLGKLILDMFPDSKTMGLFSILQEVAATGEPQSLPLRNYKDDKVDEWLDNYVFPLPSGLIVAIFSNKRVLIELKNSEQRLKIINELSSDYSYCKTLRKDGSLEHVWNVGSLANLTGYTREEFSKIGGWDGLFHPDDLELTSAYVKKLLSGEDAAFTARIITKSGAVKWIQDRGMPWFDEVTGEVVGTYGSAKDVTDIKESACELEKSELKYRMLYLNAPLPYQSLDIEGNFIDVNPAWLKTLGYERTEVIGRNFADFLQLDSKKHFEKNFQEFKVRGYAKDVEYVIQHKNGNYRNIYFEGCLAYGENGLFLQTYCVFKDVTEQKKTECENELLMKELNHRVKNNLSMVSSLVKLKSLELEGRADLTDLIGQIDAITLIHKNLEQNKGIAEVNISSYLEQLIESVFMTSPKFHISTSLKISNIPIETRTVVTLGIIINEIATNALKYGFKEGEQSVFSIDQSGDDENNIIFLISNSGNEFPEDVDIENSQGLGLKLVWSLVKQLNGVIELKKKPKTTFILKIPV